MAVVLFSTGGINIFWKLTAQFRLSTPILKIHLYSGTLGLRDHFRRHKLWVGPRLQDCLKFVDYQSVCCVDKGYKATMEASWWVIVWFCFVGFPICYMDGVWQDPNILPSRASSEKSPTFLVLVPCKVFSASLESLSDSLESCICLFFFVGKSCLAVFSCVTISVV